MVSHDRDLLKNTCTSVVCMEDKVLSYHPCGFTEFGIITQLGPDNLEDLKKIYQSFGKGGDDEVPELVENFEEVSKKDGKPAADDEEVPDLVES